MNIEVLLEQKMLLNDNFPEPKLSWAYTLTIPPFKNIYKDGKKVAMYKQLTKEQQIAYLTGCIQKVFGDADARNFYFEQHPTSCFTHIHSHGFVDGLTTSEAEYKQRLIALEFGFKSEKQIHDTCFIKSITDPDGWRKYIIKSQGQEQQLYTFGKKKTL